MGVNEVKVIDRNPSERHGWKDHLTTTTCKCGRVADGYKAVKYTHYVCKCGLEWVENLNSDFDLSDYIPDPPGSQVVG